MTWLRFVAALAVFAPAVAFAQPQGSLRVEILGVEGRTADEADNLTAVPVGTTECRTGAAITLRFMGVPAGTVLDFWRSDGSSCADVEPRRDLQNRTCRWLFSRDPQGRTAPELDPIPLVNLVGEVTDSGGTPTECAENASGTFTIWVLAANSQMSTSEVQVFGSFEIAIDTNVPAAPRPPEDATELEVTAGQTVSVDWQVTEADLRQHRVYVDPSGCTNLATGDAGAPAVDAGPVTMDAGTVTMDAGEPPEAGADAATADGAAEDGAVDGVDAAPPDAASPGLDAGDPTDGGAGLNGGADAGGLQQRGPSDCIAIVSDVPERFELIECISGTESDVRLSGETLDSLGVGFGDEFTIAVTAVDQARNESPAAVVCATRVETISPCAEFEDGQCPGGCGCAIPGRAGRNGLSLTLAFGALGGVLWRRRRRRRRDRQRGRGRGQW